MNISTAHIPVPETGSFFRKLLAFSGPGYLVAVGYMDPGNWATDLAGGAQFGYALLFVILLSNIIAMILQHLAAKLGIVTGKDLAQMHKEYPAYVRIPLWIAAEIMIIACDLAEVIGSAIALNLLFGIPMVIGIVVTALDVLLLLALQNKGFRWLEALVITLIATIFVSFGIEVFLAQPEVVALLGGFIPSASIVTNPAMLYIALGILGATVMPHNLFLHSAVVKTRGYTRDPKGQKEAIFFSTIDSTIALSFAFFVNAAILIVSASVFHFSGHTDVSDINDAHRLLAPLLGTSLASIVFAIALLASGQNSTLTGTMTGQIIMEGFLDIKIPAWMRRLATRLLAIVPAVLVSILFGAEGTGKLLVLSQVVLSIQLPFAVIPLVMFTSRRKHMGEFVNAPWLTAVTSLIAVFLVALNSWLIWSTFFS
ncbi:Nramp family divalent metal transporter [Candidatus Kaiserbacteria bacterium]|nr:Nramp family divalent metal transporter [Candidatus Kaiserbacteria bacterium]